MKDFDLKEVCKLIRQLKQYLKIKEIKVDRKSLEKLNIEYIKHSEIFGGFGNPNDYTTLHPRSISIYGVNIDIQN